MKFKLSTPPLAQAWHWGPSMQLQLILTAGIAASFEAVASHVFDFAKSRAGATVVPRVTPMSCSAQLSSKWKLLFKTISQTITSNYANLNFKVVSHDIVHNVDHLVNEMFDYVYPPTCSFQLATSHFLKCNIIQVGGSNASKDTVIGSGPQLLGWHGMWRGQCPQKPVLTELKDMEVYMSLGRMYTRCLELVQFWISPLALYLVLKDPPLKNIKEFFFFLWGFCDGWCELYLVPRRGSQLPD